ncbi:hypothetical protein Pan216_29640 [Planctomycetes bacterium Pan216]|uniref:Uncharacterized protein n=1 Tax=Kolteria novifilia TaxID=2527975 RepID=A0A518B547_9BACT|nr:hypothetical protein Pan216_29640 [Planctomycetes bacterium Pan216]
MWHHSNNRTPPLTLILLVGLTITGCSTARRDTARVIHPIGPGSTPINPHVAILPQTAQHPSEVVAVNPQTGFESIHRESRGNVVPALNIPDPSSTGVQPVAAVEKSSTPAPLELKSAPSLRDVSARTPDKTMGVPQSRPTSAQPTPGIVSAKSERDIVFQEQTRFEEQQLTQVASAVPVTYDSGSSCPCNNQQPAMVGAPSYPAQPQPQPVYQQFANPAPAAVPQRVLPPANTVRATTPPAQAMTPGGYAGTGSSFVPAQGVADQQGMQPVPRHPVNPSSPVSDLSSLRLQPHVQQGGPAVNAGGLGSGFFSNEQLASFQLHPKTVALPIYGPDGAIAPPTSRPKTSQPRPLVAPPAEAVPAPPSISSRGQGLPKHATPVAAPTKPAEMPAIAHEPTLAPPRAPKVAAPLAPPVNNVAASEPPKGLAPPKPPKDLAVTPPAPAKTKPTAEEKPEEALIPKEVSKLVETWAKGIPDHKAPDRRAAN